MASSQIQTFLPPSSESETERRYDRATLDNVIALAGRLQNEHQEALTAREIETIGAEVGIDPAFIRKALDNVREHPRTTEPAPILAAGTEAVSKEEPVSKQEMRALLTALMVPLLWLPVTAISLIANHPVIIFTLLVIPLLLTTIAGLIASSRKSGFRVGLMMGLSMLIGTLFGHIVKTGAFLFEDVLVILSIFAGVIPLLGGMGALGGWIRERYFPPMWLVRRKQRAEPQNMAGMSRSELLHALFTLQRTLEGQKRHCAFLSVDIVQSSEMKQGESELAVEHSFGQFRRWVEEVIRNYGGDVHSAAGDGIMAMFREDAAALRVARRLLEGVVTFNATLNSLTMPFRLRCGVSAGEVAIEPGASLGALNSAVIDRAANLQKQAEPGDILLGGEVAAAALVELGPITPVLERVNGETVFSWRGGRSAPVLRQEMPVGHVRLT